MQFKNDRLNLLSFSESNIGNPVEQFNFYQKPIVGHH